MTADAQIIDALILERDAALEDFRAKDRMLALCYDHLDRALRERDEARKELAREKQEHDLATTFHAVAVKERNLALVEVERLTRERDEARGELRDARTRLQEIDLCHLAQAPCEFAMQLIAERDEARAALGRILDGIPPQHNGEFFIPHYDQNGEPVEEEPVDPATIISSIAGVARAALDTKKNER